MCPCIVGVRGDNNDKSESFIGAGAAYRVVVCVLCIVTSGVCRCIVESSGLCVLCIASGV